MAPTTLTVEDVLGEIDDEESKDDSDWELSSLKKTLSVPSEVRKEGESHPDLLFEGPETKGG